MEVAVTLDERPREQVVEVRLVEKGDTRLVAHEKILGFERSELLHGEAVERRPRDRHRLVLAHGRDEERRNSLPIEVPCTRHRPPAYLGR